jgi:sarcosine oxidase
MRRCDVVVVGQGVVGLAAHASLLKRGLKVIGLDRASPGHDGGSSHGESRVTRRFNFEAPGYTPLFDRATALWRELETAPGEIYLRTGVLECGPRDHPLIAGSRASAAGASRELTPEAVRQAYPAIHLPTDWVGVLQDEGGLIRADRAIARYQALIGAHGSTIEVSRPVRSVAQSGDAVEALMADGEVIQAGAAVIAAGAWTGDLVPEVAPHLSLTRQLLGWFSPTAPALFAPARFPVFLFATPAGVIYGFPDLDGGGVKIASHEPGRPLGHAAGARQDGDVAEMAPVRAAVSALLSDLAWTPTRVKTCIYANTPDLEFIVDRRPGHPRIAFASACSGHGFKFASAIGEAAADLAIGETPRVDLTAFALSRFDVA